MVRPSSSIWDSKYPGLHIRMVEATLATSSITNEPSFFVRTFVVVFKTVTPAVATGCVSYLLTTFPVIFVCANSGTTRQMKEANSIDRHPLLVVTFVIYS